MDESCLHNTILEGVDDVEQSVYVVEDFFQRELRKLIGRYFLDRILGIWGTIMDFSQWLEK